MSSFQVDAGFCSEVQVPLDHQQEPSIREKTEEMIYNVSFHDIKYTVGSHFKKKTILQSVSGIFSQGLNAIMGPTGSGKTSLLDVLAGRNDPSGLSGTVLVNGERQPNNFKCITGYVVQDDFLVGTLSVRESLFFSASLRLPSITTRQQRKERVERVISELGLQYCANTKIGTEFIRGVSGGERKRTNIGMELIIEPKVLFLDEPTTGLDANTAASVIQKLKDLSKDRECIIIMSIHQPRYSIFKLFDTLTLLSTGNMVYHGPAKGALTYFEDNGFHCEEHENSADYFLDVIMQCETTLSSSTSFQKDDTIGGVDLVAAYQQSSQYEETEKKLKSIMEKDTKEHAINNGFFTKHHTSYSTNIFWQFLVVSNRSRKNILRNPMAAIFRAVFAIISALIIGLLYLRLDKEEFNNSTVISNRIGAMYIVLVSTIFGNISAVVFFSRQRSIFIHENASGFYRVSTFFFSKVFTDMIPVHLFPLPFFTVIAYFMVGFQLDLGKFFTFFLILATVSISAASLAFAISARFCSATTSIIVLMASYIVSMLFAGFLVSLDSISWWLEWLQYLSIFQYSLEAFCINEISGQCYFDRDNFTDSVSTVEYSCSDYIRLTNITTCELPMCVNGTDELLSRGFEVTTAWLWYDVIGLVLLNGVFLSLAYINLRTIKKFK